MQRLVVDLEWLVANLFLSCSLLFFPIACFSHPMSSSSSSARHSTRTSHPPVTLSDEQAAAELMRLEQRDVEAALVSSLQESWEEEEEEREEQMDTEEEDVQNNESEEEKKEEKGQESVQSDQAWSNNLHSIDHPSSRLRSPPSIQLHHIPPSATPLQLFQLYMPPQLVQQFVTHTNSAAENNWPPTSIYELYAYIGVHLYMGIDSLPGTDMYWKQPYAHSFVTSLFTRDRFKQITRYFSLTPPSSPASDRDPISPIQPLLTALNHSFSYHYSPSQNLTLDEAMVAFKGRVPIKQYVPMKPHKWGYKIYCLANENYLLHFEIYEGKEDKKAGESATANTVLRMVQPFENKQHILFTDSWFTSPTLAEELSRRGISSCGSVRSNRKGMPKISQNVIDELHRGEWMQLQKGEVTLAVWKDQMTMRVLYNHRSPTDVASLNRWSENGNRISLGCPQAIHDYFYHSRSVDVINQLHYSYLTGRKSMKCWSRLAWWLIDMCILNAFAIWKIQNKGGRHLEFRENLMQQLIQQHKQERTAASQSPASSLHPPYLASEHYPEHSDSKRDCVVCSHQPEHRVESRLICHACKVHLCIGNCFARYHQSI